MKRVRAFPAALQELITAPSFALFGQQTILFVCQPFHSRCFSIACRYEFSFAVARESNTMAVPKAFKLLCAIQILNHNHVLVAIFESSRYVPSGPSQRPSHSSVGSDTAPALFGADKGAVLLTDEVWFRQPAMESSSTKNPARNPAFAKSTSLFDDRSG
jgi:hypothetical protein